MKTDPRAETVAADAPDAAAGSVRQVVGDRYEILGLLGAGGMGSVYKARDRELDELVAIKVLRPEVLDAPGALERFRRELKLARRVTHPNVARVFDMSEQGGEKLLTMELVDGEPLSALLARAGALPVARAIEIASSVCAGVAAAHAAGVVHRDLKPDNVLLAKDGRVVVTDFGVARAAEGDASRTGGAFVGTPAYMAPEQIEAPNSVDQRADIYAFGAMLYEMVVGALPWQGDSVFAIAAARLLRPPPDPRVARPDLPTGLANLIVRCMARAPGDRPASIGAVSSALATFTLPQAPSELAPRGAVGAPLAAPGRRVAVLPFVNQGPADQQYIADGLTDDLVDALTIAKGLRVRARGVVARHHAQSRDAREIGRDLDVEVVIDGSVRRVGAGFRIAARVIGVADGYQLWARRFDVPEVDLLAACDVVAEAVADALGATLSPVARDPGGNAEAVDAYLRARDAYRRSFDGDRARVVALFERAHELAPNDPRVLAGLATSLLRAFPEPGMLLRAGQALDRAVLLAPQLPEVRVSRAQLALAEARWVDAVADLRRALTLAPNHPEAHDVLGRLLSEADAPEGARHLETALALDPGFDFARVGLSRDRILQGDKEGARSLIEDASGRMILLPAWTRFAVWARDAALAEQILRLLTPSTPQLAVAKQILELVVSGKPPDFRFGFPDGAVIPLTTRLFFAQLDAEVGCFVGDRERALRAVERADAAGLPDAAWIERCPILDDLRGDPVFEACGARVFARAAAIRAAYLTPQGDLIAG